MVGPACLLLLLCLRCQPAHFTSLPRCSLRPLHTHTSGYTEEEARDTSRFILDMIQILPQARKTAAQMLEHPWLEEVRALERKAGT
jgi:hypothetical protein